MTPAIRAVFLDAGGTLIHLDSPFILAALAEQGIVRDAAAFARADRAARSAVAARLHSGLPSNDKIRWKLFAHTLLTELGCDDAVAAAVRTALSSHNQAARLWCRTEEGTAATLDRLRERGYILGVVSNSNGRVDEMLRHAGLGPQLDFVIDSANVGVEKPDPRIFAIACERAGVSPAEAVHVGDIYEIDVLGARRAGVTPVLLDPDDFMPHADCRRIHVLGELLEWLPDGSR